MKQTLTVNREVTLVKIALTGKLRAGKDELSRHLFLDHDFDRVAFGDALKKNAHSAFPWVSEVSKPRSLYQSYGQLMRQIDPDVWIKHAEQTVDLWINMRVNDGADRVGVVITDLRQPNEYEWARANGFSIIRVTAPDGDRIARAIAANDDFTVHDLTHETELAIDSFEVDYEVINDGTVDDLKAQIDAILAQINGVK
jgi:dephospho-CoA kinase